MGQNAGNLSSPLGSVVTIQEARVIILVFCFFESILTNFTTSLSLAVLPMANASNVLCPLPPILILVPTPHIALKARITGIFHHTRAYSTWISVVNTSQNAGNLFSSSSSITQAITTEKGRLFLVEHVAWC